MSISYRIITIDQKPEWDKYITESSLFDFYHTWSYHKLDNEGDPLLFIFEYDNYFIALPLLKRAIGATKYFDCTSVYGYPGPITNFPAELLDSQIILAFQATLVSYLESADIVSAFSRFHPIINQDPVWDNLDGLRAHGRTITIDLSQTLEDQRGQYQRTVRSKIKQLKSKAFTVREAKTDDDLLLFIEIYRENMKRVNASPYYFFDKEYFDRLLNSPEFACKLFLCFEENTVTSGAIITFSNDLMQLHLSSTSNEYLKIGPMKLLIDEITVYGRNHGMKYLHMGGGVGGNEDSLFEFKASFSNMMLKFKTWRLISNQTVYDTLVNEISRVEIVDLDFFPLYRESNLY